MELSHWEKCLVLEGLERTIDHKKYILDGGILVNEMLDDIDEINNLINKIKDTM